MSFYVDPWLFNCTNNPADTPEDQAEQRTVIPAMQRALDYAYAHGVTLVAAAGNGATDYTKTIVDSSSPDFADVPGEAPYPRTIPTSCISMPSEGNHVLSVTQHRHLDAQGLLLRLRQRLRRPVRARRGRVRHGRQQARHHQGRARRVPEAPRRASAASSIPTGRRTHPASFESCRKRSAATTSTCRARRWRHRTRPASLRWRSAGWAFRTASTAASGLRRRRRADYCARRRPTRLPDAGGVHLHPSGPATRRDLPDRDDHPSCEGTRRTTGSTATASSTQRRSQEADHDRQRGAPSTGAPRSQDGYPASGAVQSSMARPSQSSASCTPGRAKK